MNSIFMEGVTCVSTSGSTKRSFVVAVVALAVVMSGQRAQAQPGTVLSHQKISDTEGGFTGKLDKTDFFGSSVAGLGDLDGDGVGDLAVGTPSDDDGGAARGAVWILFLNTDGTVKTHQKISDTEGGFLGILDNVDQFGSSLASLGDLDGDGVDDLAVGAIRDDDGGFNRGALWILFLNADGTVKAHQKISNTQGGFTGILDDEEFFGDSAASVGDLDGDGVTDLAVGAPLDDDGGDDPLFADRGAVWMLFLNRDGTVKSHQKISAAEGGFTRTLSDGDLFGRSVSSLDDLDGDGVGDLAVGAGGDDEGGVNHGAVWILFLNADGTVKAHQKINDTQGGFTGTLAKDDLFGSAGASLGDLDGDSVGDLAVGVGADDDGGCFDCGAVWILFLTTNGTVKSHQKISSTEGGFTGILDNDDHFGSSVASLGDLDGDGVCDLAVGAPNDDDGGINNGAVWILFLDDGPTTTPPDHFNAFRGFFDSGTLADLLESDDSDLCYEPGIVLNPTEAPVTLDFFGTLPNDSPATLDVTIESSANTVGLGLTFSFWNYNTNSWDIVGTDTQSLNVDTVRTFSGTPADHVEPGTGVVVTRYEVRQAGIVFIFPWLDCVDHVYWTTTG